MDWFGAPDYWLTRLLIERGLALVYFLAFVSAVHQFPALLGDRGLLPTPRYLAFVSFRDAPSIFHVRYSDRLLRVVGLVGAGLSLALLAGLPQQGPLWLPMLVWAVLYVLYLSIVNVGQRFYSFGWESLLCEAGFLGIFLGSERISPPWLTILLFRWLAFRIELGAGLIKLRGDPCWRDLTCMDYHHETQPMPNPISWYVHRLPRVFHRLEVVGNYVAQLVAPWLLFLPQPFAALGGAAMVATQGYLIVSGNYAWLNWLTIVAAVSAIPDAWLGLVLPVQVARPASVEETPAWFVAAVVAVTALVVVLSHWPVRNLIGPRQLMNYAFNRFHLVNTYGAFGTVTRVRYEVILEGTLDEDPTDASWREYEFIGKPGDVRRRPPQVAPYHLRLDWLMWFAALSPLYAEEWFVPLVEKLLRNDRGILGLIRHNPFPDRPPAWIRARFYRYRFTTWEERRATGQWWIRTLVGEYLPPVRLAPGALGARGELEAAV